MSTLRKYHTSSGNVPYIGKRGGDSNIPEVMYHYYYHYWYEISDQSVNCNPACFLGMGRKAPIPVAGGISKCRMSYQMAIGLYSSFLRFKKILKIGHFCTLNENWAIHGSL